MKIKKELNIEGSQKAILIATLADALSHPLRVSLIHYVSKKNNVRNDICNKDLVAHFPYSQSSLSQHVKKLVDCGIFTVEYSNKYSFYSVDQQVINKFTEAVNMIGIQELPTPTSSS